MIRAIIFDCFGVLTTDTWNAFLNALPQTADVTLARELNRAYDKGTIDHDQYLQGVKDATGTEPPDIEKLHDGGVAKNTALLKYIEQLSQKYKLGIISNISSNWIREQLLTAAEQKLFGAMVFSYEVGMTKPDSRMFTLAAERLGVAPEEAVMIDDIESFVLAARDMGMQGIVYHDFDQMKQELEVLLNP